MLPHGEVYGDTSCMIDMFDIFHIQTKNIHQLLPLACKEVNIYILYKYKNLLPDAPGTKDYATFLPLVSHPIHLPEDPDE